MKLPWLLFGLLVAMCGVVGGLFTLEEIPPGQTAGFPHELFPGMDQGGPGLQRHAPVFWLAWGFAMLQTAFLVACLALGFGVERRRRLVVPLSLGGAALAGVISMMFVSYRHYLGQEAPELIWSFPATTAWYLYGFWPVQLCFVVLYIVVFSRTIVTDEDRAAFRTLLANRSGREGDRT